ncbi:response regulator transcription factor [Paenibacillus silviterrae]|uniref:response regulator transcription factor n=1 Tax=Paenibacillus silviterrae TaxID=3242194 RepID=UPI002543BB3F|nr:response regulator transcription factor [Paenibacillus chinjuensis]
MEILLVDDHRSVIEGTKMLIESEPGMNVTIETNVFGVLDLVQHCTYDVMLFDLYMPHINGVDLAKQVRDIAPSATILIYSGSDISPHFNMLMESGISGFIAKTSTREQLINAIICAARKEAIVPMHLLSQLRRQEIIIQGDKGQEQTIISREEYKLLSEIANGKNNKEISKALMISQRSLEYSLTELFHKLHVTSRAELIRRAKNLGVLPKEELI